MRYDQPQIQSLLSAEYVLGLLTPPVRRRFERLMAGRETLREQVAKWETALTPITADLQPITPPTHVWRGIQTRLDLAETVIQKPSASGFWPAIAAALAVVSIALGVMLTQPEAVAPDSYLAVVNDDQGQPVWLIESIPQSGELKVQAIGAATPPLGRDHELWLLPGGDAAPISMGLLPASGTLIAQLPASVVSGLPAAGAVAVSLEPQGGSPTGAPTGPVLFVASLIKS